LTNKARAWGSARGQVLKIRERQVSRVTHFTWLDKPHLQKFFGSFFQKRTGNKRFFLKKEGKTFCSIETGRMADAKYEGRIQLPFSPLRVQHGCERHSRV
jgi:hypothetical protein